jgi:poly(3-hydroxybutyrate) depolymerase
MAMFGLPIGAKSDNLDTTRVMWAFFRDHPRRTNSGQRP